MTTQQQQQQRGWYVLHTLTGREDQVKRAVERARTNPAFAEKIFQVMVPTEDVVQIQKNKKIVRQRKFFPGYVLLDMVVDNETFWLVRSITGVSGFLGGDKPVPLTEKEVQNITDLTDVREGSKPRPAVTFEKGESIRINDGPFKHFVGVVEEINEEKAKLKAMVTIFGRPTPVELEYWQVEAI
jgi:transcriptional antiterminator NusG